MGKTGLVLGVIIGVVGFPASVLALEPYSCTFSAGNKTENCTLQGNTCSHQFADRLYATCGGLQADLLCGFHSDPKWPASTGGASELKQMSEKNGFYSFALVQPAGKLSLGYRENMTSSGYAVECEPIRPK